MTPHDYDIPEEIIMDLTLMEQYLPGWDKVIEHAHKSLKAGAKERGLTDADISELQMELDEKMQDVEWEYKHLLNALQRGFTLGDMVKGLISPQERKRERQS